MGTPRRNSDLFANRPITKMRTMEAVNLNANDSKGQAGGEDERGRLLGTATDLRGAPC